MSWRMEIRHVSGYRYQGEVDSSYNEARMTPLTTEHQLVLDASVAVSPPARPFRYWDYWGTVVDAFDVQAPHRELVVTASSTVETSSAPEPPSASWDALSGKGTADRFAELVAPTAYAPRIPEVEGAAASLAGRHNPLGACLAAIEWVQERVRYEPGATDVTTSATDSLAKGAGVCQDYAHLTLCLLRAMGIPGRYVSGYLHPTKDPQVGVAGAGESHAWVEAWIGRWWALDPTSGSPAGERHVLVARGRDYGDVAPLKGVYSGPPAEALGVSVLVTRLA
ncbi:MAG: transglutaminase family protein [Acidimicrobiia bacterium]